MDRLVQFLNALLPIVESDAGMLTTARLLRESNANAPMEVTPASMEIDTISLLLLYQGE